MVKLIVLQIQHQPWQKSPVPIQTHLRTLVGYQVLIRTPERASLWSKQTGIPDRLFCKVFDDFFLRQGFTR
jgi:hypothetical protein